MRFGWKVLVPTALVWILAVATMRTVARESGADVGQVAVFVGVPLALLVVAGLLIASRASNRDTRLAGRAAAAGSTTPTVPEVLPPAGSQRPPAGGFPAPPMDLVVPPSPRLGRREPVGAGAPSPQEDADV
jgi:NADH-quinone oxidoreductase subunit H